MVMDPLTAVSLAGSVVGLVDFLIKLTSTGYHLSNESGIDLPLYNRAESAARDLTMYTTRLKPHIQSAAHTTSTQSTNVGFSDEECVVIRRVCDESDAVVARLTSILEQMETHKGKRPKAAEIARLGIVAMWNKREIEELRERLDELRQSVDSTVLRAMSRRLLDVKLDTSEILDRLDKQTRQIVNSLLESQRYIVADADSRTFAITQLLNRCEGYVAVSRFSEDNGHVDPNVTHEKDIREEVTEELLDSLWFSSVAERREQVSKAHRQTFDWIFKPPCTTEQLGEERQWNDFAAWLEKGDGVFWISGKAGSGKSTLMKYIVDHRSTDNHLSQWSGSGRLLKAAFFFWNSGSKEQRSQEGLLKTLLLEILKQAPELVPVVFPLEWSKRYTMKLQSSWSFTPIYTWDLSSLEVAFQTVLEQRLKAIKICLFIDGLDEYEGDDGRIADLVVKAAESQNVKLCVSSRPHIIFADTFSKLPRLRLQDLTHPDIVVYVSDVLLKDRRMKLLIQSSPGEAQSLADRIVTGASGVFLWVNLVVASLLRGLGNHDKITTLYRRLEELPTDLEQLFYHMIRQVDKVYQSEASRLFQLVAMVYDDMERKLGTMYTMSPLTLFGAVMAEAEESLVFASPQQHTMGIPEIVNACKDMSDTITSRSGGLLEVQCGVAGDVTPSTKISYLHRTVKDFMLQSSVRSLLSERTGGTESLGFQPSISLLRSAVLCLKVSEHFMLAPPVPTFVELNSWWSNALVSVIQVDRDTTEVPQIDLIDVFFAMISPKNAAKKDPRDSYYWLHWLHNIFLPLRDLPSCLAFAARFGLEHFLKAKLGTLSAEADSTRQDKLDGALRCALDPAYTIGSMGTEYTSPTIVHMLLQHGADPNRHYSGMAPLTQCLSYLAGLGKERKHSDLLKFSQILNELLDHGAHVLLDVAAPLPPHVYGASQLYGHDTNSQIVYKIFVGTEFDALRRRFMAARQQQQSTPQNPKRSKRRFCCFG